MKAAAANIKSRGPRHPSLIAPLSPNKPTTGAFRPAEERSGAKEAAS
jgi:hypothetical protein